MKYLFQVAALSALSVFSAFAGELPNEQDSWDAILEDKNVKVNTPSIRLHSQYGSIDYSIFSVCQKNDELFLKSGETTICLDNTSYEYRNKGGGVCRFKKEVTLSTSLEFTRPVCVQPAKGKGSSNQCRKWEDLTIAIPTQYNIAVRAFFPSIVGKAPSRVGAKLFIKEYQIPACGTEAI